MKTPIDIVRGRIADYDPMRQELTIKAHYDDWYTLVKRGYKDCIIQLIDSRPLSDRQRRTCYKLIREISNYTTTAITRTFGALSSDVVGPVPTVGLAGQPHQRWLLQTVWSICKK